jgi:chemotaxis protein methyltransferase CheR
MEVGMDIRSITQPEFQLFKKFIYGQVGISLSDNKQSLVSGRLAKRLKYYNFNTFKQYYEFIHQKGNEAEQQVVVDFLTTNETYFFREPKHFDFIRDKVLPQHNRTKQFRVWSAACSSGEEPYTLAMVLAEHLQSSLWEIIASDVSTRVLETATRGRYPQDVIEDIPRNYLLKYCLKGTGSQDGVVLISKELRRQMRFQHINLMHPLPKLGELDMIFLRNVMIYFDNDTKRALLDRMYTLLKPGGYLFISHSESLNGISEKFKIVQPSIYQRPL